MDVRKYQRKATVVEAVRVTWANGPEVAEWCGGEWISPAPGVGWVEVPETLGATKAFIGHFVIHSLTEFYATDSGVFGYLYDEADPSVPLTTLGLARLVQGGGR